MDIPTYRSKKNLSQSDFAALLVAAGYPATQGLVSQWESGKVKITADRAKQIHEVTGGEVSREFLLFGEAA